MKWFKHDSDAHMDAKLKRVRMKYGLEGYGLYWYCIELISSTVEVSNLTFELEHDAEIIGFDTGIHPERVQEMMTYMVNLGLFENSSGRITCLKLAKRLDQSMTSNPQMRQIIKNITSPTSEVELKADELVIHEIMTESKENHDSVMTKSAQIRLDKIRKEKDKENINTVDENAKKPRFVAPTLEQIHEYCSSRRNNVDPEKFFAHYTSNGWRVGRNAMKDWQAAVRYWEKSSETNQRTEYPSRAKRVSDKLDEIARRDLEERGFAEFLGKRVV